MSAHVNDFTCEKYARRKWTSSVGLSPEEEGVTALKPLVEVACG